MDANGQVSREEFFVLIPKSEEGEALFVSDDKDSDGVISWDEFSGPKGTAETEKQRLDAAAAAAVGACLGCLWSILPTRHCLKADAPPIAAPTG